MAKKVRKQRKKRDFTKIKGVISTVLKVFKKIAVAIVGLTSLIAFLVVPFLHNCIDHTLAQWVWYPAIAILALKSIIENVRNKRPMFKTQLFNFLRKWGEFGVYPIFISIFVFNYYEIDYAWMWVIFGMVVLLVFALFFSLWIFYIKTEHPSEENKQKSLSGTMKAICLYWMIDLFYMSIFNDWLIPTFVFGILSVVIISLNLTTVFLNGTKNLRFFVVLEMILALIMSGYLIFIIPNEKIQEIVLTIIASLLGGVLTLLGVAWTIKKADEDKRDMQRLSLKPWIVWVHERRIVVSEQQNCFFSLSGCRETDSTAIACLKNTDNGIAILKKIITAQFEYYPSGDATVDKNSKFILRVSFDESDRQEDMRLIVEDVLHNEYEYRFITGDFPERKIGLFEVTNNE